MGLPVFCGGKPQMLFKQPAEIQRIPIANGNRHLADRTVFFQQLLGKLKPLTDHKPGRGDTVLLFKDFPQVDRTDRRKGCQLGNIQLRVGQMLLQIRQNRL